MKVETHSNYLQVGLIMTKLFLTCRQGNVKSLMKTLRLHIIVIESP